MTSWGRMASPNEAASQSLMVGCLWSGLKDHTQHFGLELDFSAQSFYPSNLRGSIVSSHPVSLHLCQVQSLDSQVCAGPRARHCRALQTYEGLILLGHPFIVPSLSRTNLSSVVKKYSLYVFPFIFGIAA